MALCVAHPPDRVHVSVLALDSHLARNSAHQTFITVGEFSLRPPSLLASASKCAFSWSRMSGLRASGRTSSLRPAKSMDCGGSECTSMYSLSPAIGHAESTCVPREQWSH